MTRLRVIDFETNGTEPPAEVLECGWCDLARETLDGPWEIGEPVSFLYGCDALKPELRAIHHIRPDEIAGLAPFDPASIIGRAIGEGISCVVAHAWHFEGQWLTADRLGPLHALCTYKAALRVWPDAPSHSNGALRYWLEDQGLIAPDPALCQPAHRAAPDAYVTAHILRALLARVTGREMIAWTKEPAMLPRCPIGDAWRGKPWRDVDAGFLRWMIDKPVEADLVWNARRELERRRAA